MSLFFARHCRVCQPSPCLENSDALASGCNASKAHRPKPIVLLSTYHLVRSKTPYAFLDPLKMLKMSRKLL